MAKHVLKAEPTQADEPIDLAVARLHLKLDEDLEGEVPTHPDDALVNVLISAAREHVESFTGLSLVNREHRLSVDAFNGRYLDLEVWPVTNISGFTYLDADGVIQPLPPEQYRLDNSSRPARLYPAGSDWPATKKQENAVIVTYQGGFTKGEVNPFPMPKALKQAMLLIIGHLYENRQDVIHSSRTGGQLELPMGSVFLMTPHRINMRL